MRKAFANWQFRAFLYAFVGVSELFAGLRIYELIDKTSDAIQAWAVTVLAGITAIYAWQTKAQAEASVKMAEEMQRPVIVFKPLERTLWYPKNVGTGPAVDTIFLYKYAKQQYRYKGPPLGSNETWETWSSDTNLSPRPKVMEAPVTALYKSVDGRYFSTLLKEDGTQEVGPTTKGKYDELLRQKQCEREPRTHTTVL